MFEYSNVYIEYLKPGFKYSVYILETNHQMSSLIFYSVLPLRMSKSCFSEPQFLIYTVKKLDQMISMIFSFHKILILLSIPYAIFSGS